MKYSSVNRLEDFYFHDSVMESGRITDSTLTASLRYLNIHTGTPQNDGEFDMEIELAQITFEGVRELTAGNLPSQQISAEGVVTNIESVILSGDEARELLIELLEYDLIIFSLDQPTPGLCVFDTCNGDIIRFSFDRVTIEWDDYSGRAWYESDQWREYRRKRQEQLEGQEQS